MGEGGGGVVINPGLSRRLVLVLVLKVLSLREVGGYGYWLMMIYLGWGWSSGIPGVGVLSVTFGISPLYTLTMALDAYSAMGS